MDIEKRQSRCAELGRPSRTLVLALGCVARVVGRKDKSLAIAKAPFKTVNS